MSSKQTESELAGTDAPDRENSSEKIEQLEVVREDATCAALPPSSIPTKATLIWSATICRCFFIQDAIKFPDFVHAVKPEPHSEIPTGQSAHDTFWDFVSLTPESVHLVLWTMSDRAIPVHYRAMQGFGVHTFRMINAEGKSVFVKFHWRPVSGVFSLVWDEAQKLAGKDPDFDLLDPTKLSQYRHAAGD